MKKRIRVQGTLIFWGVVLFVLFIGFTMPRWVDRPREEFFDILGMVFILSGFLVRIVARGYKQDMSRGGDSLVVDGPYSLMRNPMYFGTLLIGAGIIAVLLRLWTLPVFVIVYLAIYMPQIDREEKLLLERFGPRYKEYCRITPKYFPNIFRIFQPGKPLLVLKWFWVKKETSSLAWTIVFVFIMEIWQDVRLFGRGALVEEFLELSGVLLIFGAVVYILHLAGSKRKQGRSSK
jgi:protein-S-isoprenylcysteine O-methyltransferase Ste14